MGSSEVKVAIILGTRPEIIKMSPIIGECSTRKLDYFILHTNQHYSESLDRVFFDELELPNPRYNLRVGSGTHAKQIGKMLVGIEEILIREEPDVVLVEGDTNTVLAGALVASRLHITIGHVEAGLRSYCREMPEEVNRVLVDHCSDLLFAPTMRAGSILLGEGISRDKTFVTGNTIVDAVYRNLGLAQRRSHILEELGLEKEGYLLATAHREENVDKKERLEGILGGLRLVCDKLNLPMIFPTHPRTKKMIGEYNIEVPAEVRLIDPVGYLDFLQLEANAVLVLTDSGGIQEEACILKIPCITLRDNTERPETLEVGSNLLAGAVPRRILRAARAMLEVDRGWENPFGGRGAGRRIIDVVIKNS